MSNVYGKRDRGRPQVRYSDNIKEIVGGRSIEELFRLTQDRAK